MTNSIMTLLTLGSGPLVAFLVSKAGHRRVTIAGAGRKRERERERERESERMRVGE